MDILCVFGSKIVNPKLCTELWEANLAEKGWVCLSMQEEAPGFTHKRLGFCPKHCPLSGEMASDLSIAFKCCICLGLP